MSILGFMRSERITSSLRFCPPESVPAFCLRVLESDVECFINSLAPEFPSLRDCHDVRARQVEHKTLISCHCTMDGNLPITQIHDVTALLEDRVRGRFPQIARVTIHPEPPGAR